MVSPVAPAFSSAALNRFGRQTSLTAWKRWLELNPEIGSVRASRNASCGFGEPKSWDYKVMSHSKQAGDRYGLLSLGNLRRLHFGAGHSRK